MNVTGEIWKMSIFNMIYTNILIIGVRVYYTLHIFFYNNVIDMLRIIF